MPSPNKPYRCTLCKTPLVFLPEKREGPEDLPTPLEPCPTCNKVDGLHRLQVTHLVAECDKEEAAYTSSITGKHYRYCCKDATKLVSQGKRPVSYTDNARACTCHDCLLVAKAQPTTEVLE